MVLVKCNEFDYVKCWYRLHLVLTMPCTEHEVTGWEVFLLVIRIRSVRLSSGLGTAVVYSYVTDTLLKHGKYFVRCIMVENVKCWYRLHLVLTMSCTVHEETGCETFVTDYMECVSLNVYLFILVLCGRLCTVKLIHWYCFGFVFNIIHFSDERIFWRSTRD